MAQPASAVATTTSDALSPVERAEQIAGLVAQHQVHGERNRCLAPGVVDAMRSAGMFMLCAPREVGGLEATPREIFEATRVIATADPAAAWYMTNSTGLAHAGAWIPESHRAEVYRAGGNFGAGVAPGGRLRPVDGGFHLDGEWPLVTGIKDAPWTFLNAILTGDGDERLVRTAVVPTSSITIDEVWNEAAAMKGTGSHRVTVDDLIVPAELVLDLRQPSILGRPRFDFIWMGLLGGLANAAVPVGILATTLEAAAGELRDKVSTVSGFKAYETASILELIAEAAQAMHSLTAGTVAATDALWEAIERGQPPSSIVKARCSGTMFYAGKVAREYVSEIYSRSSRQAFFEGHPLERCLRNVHAVAYGFESLRPIQHDIGRVELGLNQAAF